MLTRRQKWILAGVIYFFVVTFFCLTNTGQFYAKKIFKYITSTEQKSGWTKELITKGIDNTLVLTTKSFIVDSIYPSMTGPSDLYYLNLIDQPEQELLWLCGYENEVILPAGIEYEPTDFMCHNNLDFGVKDYYKKFGIPKRAKGQSTRLATLTQGQTNLSLPKGFGIPIWSNDNLSVASQVLNLNIEEANFSLNHKIKFHYQEDKDLKRRPIPLYQQSISLLAQVTSDWKKQSEETLLIRDCRPAIATSNFITTDTAGNTYSGHWIINPGKEIKRYDVTKMLNLQFDTKIHHIGVHVHAFTEYLALRDITLDSIIYKASTKTFDKKIGLKYIDHYSSKEGISVYKDHQYELICSTNNASKKEQDMMAVMLLYLRDRDLEQKLGSKTNSI